MCGDDQRTPARNGLCRPFQCVIGRFHRRTIIRPSVITMELLGLQSLRMSRDNLCSSLQCVEDFSTRVCISHVGKHACELGLISGTPNGYQLKVEIPALLKFHPHLEVKGIPSDVLSDPGFYPVYNPHHVIYGLSALIAGVILVVIGVICVRKRCADKAL